MLRGIGVYGTELFQECFLNWIWKELRISQEDLENSELGYSVCPGQGDEGNRASSSSCRVH